MSTAEPPDRGRTADRIATVLLLLLHVGLALCTSLAVHGYLAQQQETEGRCSVHGLDCSDPALVGTAWLALGCTAVLLLLDFVIAIRRRVKRRLAFFVPLLGCAGQVIVIAAPIAANS